MGLTETERRTRLRHLLRMISAADNLARRRYFVESTRLYEEVAREFTPSLEDSIPPAPDLHVTPTLALERGRSLRARIAATLRAEWSDTLRPWQFFVVALRRSRSIAALGVVAILLLFVRSRVVRRDLAAGARWESSTATQGAKKSNVFPDLGAFGDVPNYFCHTKEENAPHLDVDLATLHHVTSVEVTNRIDCCTERARGLELWLGEDKEHFRKVAVRPLGDESRLWTVNLPGAPARFIRIALPGKRILHLARVRVFDS